MRRSLKLLLVLADDLTGVYPSSAYSSKLACRSARDLLSRLMLVVALRKYSKHTLSVLSSASRTNLSALFSLRDALPTE